MRIGKQLPFEVWVEKEKFLDLNLKNRNVYEKVAAFGTMKDAEFFAAARSEAGDVVAMTFDGKPMVLSWNFIDD